MEIIGWLSAILLALCGVPLAYRTVRDRHADGVDLWFLILWTLGEVLGLGYVLALGSWPLVFNYLVNTIACLIILRYKL